VQIPSPIHRFRELAPLCAALVAFAVAFSGGMSAAGAQVGGNAPAGVAKTGRSAFSGSMVSIRPTVSARTLDRSAEPTWNPYVATQMMLAPRYAFTSRVSVSALLIAAREHTNSDWTTEDGETTLSDTFLTGNFRLFSHKGTGLGLGASAQLRLPTSKASQARTMVAATLAGLSASWGKGFSVLGAKQSIAVQLIGRAGRFWHENAEASLEKPWLADCGSLPTGCARFSHNGRRNVAWRTQLIGALSYRPHPKVSFAIQAGSFYDMLEPLPDTTAQGFTVSAHPNGANDRGIAFYILSASWQPHAAFAIAAGTETANAHLAPDSTYRTPFFNRNTLIFVSLRAFPAALL